MKKLVFLFVLAAAVAGGAFGQAWYNSYAPGIEGSKLFVNAGIGIGILPYKMSLPPISASVEYAFPRLPLSVGGYFAITGYNGEDKVFSISYNYKGTRVGVGAKASYHFNFLKNLDPYVGLVLGWMVESQEVKVTYTQNVTATGKNDLSKFLAGFNLGARYFFTNNIGAYLEVGYSAVSVASAGLALKF